MTMNDRIEPAEGSSRRDLIESFMKGIEVITAFDDQSPRLSATEVARRVGLSRAAARRYLVTLAHMGLAASDGRNFWLTPKVLSLGHSYLASARLPRTVAPFLQRLTQQLQESTNFAVLDGTDAVYVARVNAPRLMTMSLEPGTRLPATTSAAGSVILAAMSDAERADWLERATFVAFTPQTMTDRQEWLAHMAQIRKQGYAVLENQFEIGFRGIAVPLKTLRGQVVGALGVSMSIASCPQDEAVQRCVPALQKVAQSLMALV